MKVTLVCSPDDAKGVSTLQALSETLKKGKHRYNKAVLRKGFLGRQGKGKFYTNIKTNIRNGDAVIVELTNPSTEIGFIVSEALAQRKPVLALVSKRSKLSAEEFFMQTRSKFLMIKKYSKADIDKIVEKFIEFASTKVDSKFILIITPEIDTYLRWKAKEEGVRKAEVVRRAVEEHIKKDEAYQSRN